MAFADLKNDFVFRRIFARRPDLLQALLNDLLERRGERAIEQVDYLPSEQLPLVAGAKLSILDVRCRDKAGTTFVVEMQLLHVAGFGNRVVYNACKAYVDQLRQGEGYTKLADVVAVSICDFALWPDAQQDAAGQPHVPMLSRWSVTERASGASGLLQVQYAFLELPKLGASRPPPGAGAGADWWAWLFVHAPELREVPAELPEGAYREALALANEATFTTAEHEAYRRAIAEIQQAREYGLGQRAEGKEEGLREGEMRLMRRLLGKRLGRALREIEEKSFEQRLEVLGPERLEEVLLGLAPAELEVWLADPSAR
jgi:predicted transposase/invertase (TIGR01784 family)